MTRSNPIRTAVAALAAGALMSTAACGLGGSGAGDAKEAERTGKVAGGITFRTLQLKPTFTGYVQAVIDAFEKKYPEVKVNWEDVPGDGYNEKLVADAQAGALPDVVNLSTDSFQLLGDRACSPTSRSSTGTRPGSTYPAPGSSSNCPGRATASTPTPGT